MTDTGAYAVVFGLFRLAGFRFCPWLADVGGTRFWSIDADADYGPLNSVARQCIKLGRITPHWDDMLRTVGSLKLGRVPATGIMRALQVGDRPTSLAQVFAEFGRIDRLYYALRELGRVVKTCFLLRYISDLGSTSFCNGCHLEEIVSLRKTCATNNVSSSNTITPKTHCT